MIALPSNELPIEVRLRLLAEHVELELLKIAIHDGTPPALAVGINPCIDQPRKP